MVSSESNKFFQLPMLVYFYIWSIYGFHVNASVTRERHITKAATQGTVMPTSSIHTERKPGEFLLPSNNTEATLKINHPHPLTVKLMFFAEAQQKSHGNSSKIQPTISNGTTKSPPSSKSSYDTDSDLMPLLRPPPNITKDDWPKIRYKPVVTSTVQNITSNVTSEFLNKLPPLSSSVKRSVTSSQIPFNPIQGMLRNVGAGSRATGINQRPFSMPPHNTHGGIVDMHPVRRMLAVSQNNQQRRGSITPLARILSNVNKRRESINNGSTNTNPSVLNLHFPRPHQAPKQTHLVQGSSNTNSENGQSTMQQHNIRIGSINRPLFLSPNFGRYGVRTGNSTINSTIQGNEEINGKKSIPSKSHNSTDANQGPDRAGRAIHLVSADDSTSKDNPFRLASRYAQKFEFARAQLRKNVQNSTSEQSVQISIDNPGHYTLQEIYAKQVDKPISLNHSSINQRIHQPTFQRTSNPEYTELSNKARTYFYIPRSQTRPNENNESTGTSQDRAHVASYTLKVNQTQPRSTSSTSSTILDKTHLTSYTVPTSTGHRTNTQNISQKDITMPIYHTISLFNRNKERFNPGNGVPTNYAHQRNLNTYTHTNEENARANDPSLVRNTNRTNVKTTSEDGQRKSVTAYHQNKELAVQGIQGGSILQTGRGARVSDHPSRMKTHQHELLVDRIPNNNSTGNKSHNHGMEQVPGYGTYQKDIKSVDILETQRNKGTSYFQSTTTTRPNKPTNQSFISRDQMPYRREPESSGSIFIPNVESTTSTSGQRSHRLSGINVKMTDTILDSTRQFRPDTTRPSDSESVVSSPMKTTASSQPEPLKLYKSDVVNRAHPKSLRLTDLESITQTHQGYEESHQHLLQPTSLDSVSQTHPDSQVDSSVLKQSRVDSLHPLSQDTQGLGPPHPELMRPTHPDSVSHSKKDSGRSVNTDPLGLGSPATSQHHSTKLASPTSDSLHHSTLDYLDPRLISSDSRRSSQFDSVSQSHLVSARPSHQNPKLQPRLDSARSSHLTNLGSPRKSHRDMIQSSRPSLAQTSVVDTLLPQTTNHHHHHLHEGQNQYSHSIFDQFLSGTLEGPYSNTQTNLSVISDGTPVNSASNQEQVIYGRVRGGRMTERISDIRVIDPSTDIIDNSSSRALSTNPHQRTPQKDQRIFSGHYQPIIPMTADKHLGSHRLGDSMASGQYQRNSNAGRSHLISSQRSTQGRSNSRQEIAISESPTISSNISQLPSAQSFSNNAGPTIHQPHSDPVASLRDDSMLDFLSWLVDAANAHYNISTETSTKPPYSDYLLHNTSQHPSRQISSQLNDSTLNLLKFIAEYNSSSATGSEMAPMTYQKTDLQSGRIGSMSGPRSQHPIQLSVTTSTTQQPPKTQVYTSTTPNPQETIQRLIATLQQAVAKQNSIASSQVTVSANHTIDELVVKTVNSIVRIQALKSLDCRAVSFLYTISLMEYLPMRCDKSCPALTKCMNVGSIGFCCPLYVTNHMIQMELMKATTSADNDMLSV